MILSSKEIKELVTSGEIIIEPFHESLLKSASYTFTLGDTLRKLKPVDFIDSRIQEKDFEEIAIGEEGYMLQPGEFVILHTNELLKLSAKIACFLAMRGAPAQAGLDALQNEIFCEPGSEGGWNGKLMLETSNRGPYPIKLFPGINIIKAVFVKLQQ